MKKRCSVVESARESASLPVERFHCSSSFKSGRGRLHTTGKDLDFLLEDDAKSVRIFF